MNLCPTHLIFLRELQIVVGLEELCVLGQLGDGDGGVVHHACSSNGEEGRTQGRRRRKESVSTADINWKTLTAGDFPLIHRWKALVLGKLVHNTVNFKQRGGKSDVIGA